MHAAAGVKQFLGGAACGERLRCVGGCVQVENSFAARYEALEVAMQGSCCRPDPPGVQALLAGLGSLQTAAEDLQDQFGRLEAQAAVLIQQKHVSSTLAFSCSLCS